VFISYANDSPEHTDLVRRFYEFLRIDCGIDAVFDLQAAETPRDWTAWMTREMAEADFILCVASPGYRDAADAKLAADVRRGAQWETRQLREMFFSDDAAASRRVLAVVLPGGSTDDIPLWMGPRGAHHYALTELTRDAAEPLLRYLTNQPDYVEPALGRLPTFGSSRTLRLEVRDSRAQHQVREGRIQAPFPARIRGRC